MKVLQINAIYGTKSTGIIVKDIENMLKSHGHKAHIACRYCDEKDENIFIFNNKAEQNFHALMTRLIGRQGFGSFFETKKFIKKIKQLNPDIIHLHNLHSNFINLPAILKYCAKNKKNVVLTLHDSWFFTGKCYHFQDASCERWKTQCEKCPKQNMEIPSMLWDSSRAVFRLKKKLFSQIENLHIVGCSNWITENAKQSPMFKNKEFYTIYNGVDTNIFSPKNLKESYEAYKKFRILVMANKWFLPENKTIREGLCKRLDESFEIIVVGCSNEQMKPNEDDKVIKIGYVSGRSELADLYRSANVFLNLTFIDTLPTVNMESICCGTPVITYNSGGSPELVVEGKTGYVVNQLDLESIISSILSVKNGKINPKNCAEIGKKSFDKENNYKKYLELYSRIMKTSSTKRKD